jgi:muconolactone delta-isomerase
VLFLVISTPRPERPSKVVALRKKFWRWIDPKLKSTQCRLIHARAGRGAIALFDVKSNDELHALLNEWADIIPAQFDVYPLVDSTAARRYLATAKRGALV